MRPMETAAKIVAGSAIPLWIGASGAPLSRFCFYLLVAVPLFSVATEISRSRQKLTLARGLGHVPELYAWFIALGFASFAAGSLIAGRSALHLF